MSLTPRFRKASSRCWLHTPWGHSCECGLYCGSPPARRPGQWAQPEQGWASPASRRHPGSQRWPRVTRKRGELHQPTPRIPTADPGEGALSLLVPRALPLPRARLSGTKWSPLGGSKRTGWRVKGPRPRRSGTPGVRLADRSPLAAGEPRRVLSWGQRGRGSSGVGGLGALWGRQLPSGQTRGESHLVQGSTLLVKPLRRLL